MEHHKENSARCPLHEPSKVWVDAAARPIATSRLLSFADSRHSASRTRERAPDVRTSVGWRLLLSKAEALAEDVVLRISRSTTLHLAIAVFCLFMVVARQGRDV